MFSKERCLLDLTFSNCLLAPIPLPIRNEIFPRITIDIASDDPDLVADSVARRRQAIQSSPRAVLDWQRGRARCAVGARRENSDLNPDGPQSGCVVAPLYNRGKTTRRDDSPAWYVVSIEGVMGAVHWAVRCAEVVHELLARSRCYDCYECPSCLPRCTLGVVRSREVPLSVSVFPACSHPAPSVI